MAVPRADCAEPERAPTPEAAPGLDLVTSCKYGWCHNSVDALARKGLHPSAGVHQHKPPKIRR